MKIKRDDKTYLQESDVIFIHRNSMNPPKCFLNEVWDNDGRVAIYDDKRGGVDFVYCFGEPESRKWIDSQEFLMDYEILSEKSPSEIEDMISEYKVKEAHTRNLIEKRFEPPQLTYSRFIGVVDKSTKMFNHQSDSALTMINLANDYSPKIENEIKSKISVLRQIISKLDDLTNELVLTMEKSDDDEINSLFDDMSNLINSVNDYD